MGVITEADEQKRIAEKAVNEAISSISKIVIEECWGADGYTSDHRRELQRSLFDLLDIRERLSGSGR